MQNRGGYVTITPDSGTNYPSYPDIAEFGSDVMTHITKLEQRAIQEYGGWVFSATRKPITMGKLNVAIWGTSGRGNQNLRAKTGTIVMLFAEHGLVQVTNRGQRNQTVTITNKGLVHACRFPEYEQQCKWFDELEADNFEG